MRSDKSMIHVPLKLIRAHYIANQHIRLGQHSTLLFRRISFHGKYRRPFSYRWVSPLVSEDSRMLFNKKINRYSKISKHSLFSACVI